MEGKGPRFERETVITFNEEEAEAVIWTASETIYRRLIKRLGRSYLAEDGERHAVFKFPKEFISLPRLKAQKSLTPTQRAELASRLSRSPQNVGEKRQSGVSITKPETDNGLMTGYGCLKSGGGGGVGWRGVTKIAADGKDRNRTKGQVS